MSVFVFCQVSETQMTGSTKAFTHMWQTRLDWKVVYLLNRVFHIPSTQINKHLLAFP